MKNRSVFFGRDQTDQEVFVTMELKASEKKVVIHTFPKEKIDDAFVEKMNKEWVEGKEVEFPEGFTMLDRSTDEEHLLPIEIKTDMPEKLKALQNEWTLKILSVRLYESINGEIGKLEGNLKEAGSYSRELWEGAKKTWNNIGEHAKEFNLSREHTSTLRDRLNGFFDELKEKRGAHQEELTSVSKEARDAFASKLEEVKAKVSDKVNLNELFDRLKSIQKEINGADLLHKDRTKLWKTLDDAFSRVKDQRQSLRSSHLGKRVQGLENAIGKMEDSIKRDKEANEFQKRKLDSPASSQIEHQLRSTKIKVIDDRIRSKEEKLTDMYQTLEQLKSKMAKAAEADAKAAAAKEKAAAEKAAMAAEAAAKKAAGKKAAAAEAAAAKAADSSAAKNLDKGKSADDMLAEAAESAIKPPVAAAEVAAAAEDATANTIADASASVEELPPAAADDAATAAKSEEASEAKAASDPVEEPPKDESSETKA